MGESTRLPLDELLELEELLEFDELLVLEELLELEEVLELEELLELDELLELEELLELDELLELEVTSVSLPPHAANISTPADTLSHLNIDTVHPSNLFELFCVRLLVLSICRIQDVCLMPILFCPFGVPALIAVSRLPTYPLTHYPLTNALLTIGKTNDGRLHDHPV